MTRYYLDGNILPLWYWGGGVGTNMNYAVWSRLFDIDHEKVEDLMLIEKDSTSSIMEAVEQAQESEFYVGETVLRIVTALNSAKVYKYMDLYKNLDRKTIWNYLVPKGPGKNLEIFKDTRKKGIYYFVDTKYIGTILDKVNHIGLSLTQEVVNWEIRDEELALPGETSTQRSVVAKPFIISFRHIENITIDQIFDECQM